MIVLTLPQAIRAHDGRLVGISGVITIKALSSPPSQATPQLSGLRAVPNTGYLGLLDLTRQILIIHHFKIPGCLSAEI